MSSSEKLNFTTHAQLKNVIGQDLINDDTIAIVELVKNGFDAGSAEVTITFSSTAGTSSSVPSSISIRDYGRGMSKVDIEKKWLNIAYSEKRSAPKSDAILAGNKGVGRFACDRLGKTLELYTRQGESAVHRLKIDWTAFDRSDARDFHIEQVPVFLDRPTSEDVKDSTLERSFRSGTLLKITDLRSEWDAAKLLSLRRALERFIDPNAAVSRGVFDIYIVAPNFKDHDRGVPAPERIGGKIENRIYQELRFKTTYIESRISSDGSKIETQLWHDGRRVYEISEKNVEFPLLANMRVLIHYMNPYKKAYFRRRTGLHMVEFGSIFLFVNAFRIPPYGDRNNDWLGLDNRKVQHANSTLGCRELLGRIEVTDDAKRFRVVSNREGVVMNPAFVQLTSKDGYFYRCFKRLERFVVDGLAWDSVPEPIRRELDTSADTIHINEAKEEYTESTEKKQRRVALELTRLLDAKPENTLSLSLDTTLVQQLSKAREEEVKGTLDRLAKFGSVVDNKLKRALQDVRSRFAEQQERLVKTEKELKRSTRNVERLRKVARKTTAEAREVRETAKTKEAELLFLKSATSIDHETLMLFHHQIAITADVVRNYLDSILRGLNQQHPGSPLIPMAEKAVLAITKVISVSQLSTKANFRLRTQVLTADIVEYVRQYIETVASEFSAANLSVSVSVEQVKPFILKFKPIDLSIVFDNLASNATRAHARHLSVRIERRSENELEILVEDDGDGLAPEIKRPDSVFERGISTTRGSGLGLYHVRQTIEGLGGTVKLARVKGRGFAIVIRILK